jgi:hypothetical protein
MGAPTSALFSKIYFQYTEHNKIYNLLQENHVIGYYRYVDDILIIYNTNNTKINKTQTDLNNIPPTLHFTVEKEHNQINFLDITVTRKDSNLTYNIYRKPTSTSHIILNLSCHPPEHKTLAIKYLTHRHTCFQKQIKNTNYKQ